MLSQKKILFLCFLTFFTSSSVLAQTLVPKIGFYFKKENKKKALINFKHYNNLVIVPLVLNKIDTLNFILDTGSGHILITDPNIANILKFPNHRDIQVSGPSGGVILEAYVSTLPQIKLGRHIVASHQQIIVLKKAIPHLSQNAGIKIHGLIGYELFKAFAIKLHYDSQRLTFYHSKKLKVKKKWKEFALEFEQKKPYIDAQTLISSETQSIPLKLLVDIGAGHALSLDVGSHPAIQLPQNNILVDLGMTISGEITGSIARVEKFNLDKFEFKNVITSFPDSISLQYLKNNYHRQGSLGYGVLKRFDIIFDYPHNKMYLKPNHKYKEVFQDNTSGISLVVSQENFMELKISDIRKNSAADLAGLQSGDILFSVDGKIIEGKTISEVYHILNQESGKIIQIIVVRAGKGLIAKNLQLKEMI